MITNPFENRKKKEPVDIRKVFGLGSPLSTPTAGAKMSTSPSAKKREPFTKSTFPIPEHKEPVDIRKVFGLGSPLSTPTARAKMSTSPVRDLPSGLVPEHKEPVDIRKIFGLGSPLSTPTAGAKMSTSPSVQEREPFPGLRDLLLDLEEKKEPVDIRKIFGLIPTSPNVQEREPFTGSSGEPFSVKDPLSGLVPEHTGMLDRLLDEKKPTFPIPKHTGMLDGIKELEASTGVPFGNQPTGNPFNLTTPGILEGVVEDKEMPYDNQLRVRFPDEIKAAQELASTPAPQVPEQAVPAQSQDNGSSDRINQLIALGKAMGGNEEIDRMIVGAILEEMMSERESRIDELAQAYQLTQDPLIGKEFATGLYEELGIDPIKAQKEQMLMEKFLEEFQESAETADIFEAVRRNPSLVEQYFNLTEQEGKGFLGLNNTENKRLERMRRLMGVK